MAARMQPIATWLARRRATWLALAGYAGYALLLTWPLVLHLGDRFPGDNTVDAWGHYWNMWWFRRALLSGANPFYTDLWFRPEGTSLLLHTLAPYNSLLGLLPTLVAGPLVAYNLVALAAIVLAGQGAFLLARHVTGHAGAGFVAGLAFAGSPYLMGHLNVGHLNVAALGWLPLFVLALLRAGEGARRAIPQAGCCLLLTALCEWHTTLFAILIGGVLAGWQALLAVHGRGPWAGVGRMALGGLLGGLLVAPLALATALALESVGERADLGDRWADQLSANLLAFFVPQDLHPLWGPALAAWRKQHIVDVLSEGRVSLGLVVLALAVLGLGALRWRAAPWLFAALAAIGLAIGPDAHVGTRVYRMETLFDLFDALPFADVSRTPARFSAVAVLALTVLAAAGIAGLARGLSGRRAALAVALAGLLVAGEFLTLPFPLEAPPDQTVARWVGEAIAATDPEGTILTLPIRRAEQERVFHQVDHGRPIYGGFIPRDVEHPFRTNTPGFADLALARPFRDIFEAAPDPLAVLEYYRVRYILLYRGEVSDDPAGRAFLANLRQVLRQSAPTFVSEDGALEAWHVPPATLATAFLRADQGWFPVETWPTLGRTRWMGQQALLYLERPRPVTATIRFVAVSYAVPRRLEVLAGNQVLGTFTVLTEPTDIVVTVPPAAGSTRLTLRSLDGTDSPANHGNPRDARHLSIALARVRLTEG
jgi:hypothetical protein